MSAEINSARGSEVSFLEDEDFTNMLRAISGIMSGYVDQLQSKSKGGGSDTTFYEDKIPGVISSKLLELGMGVIDHRKCTSIAKQGATILDFYSEHGSLSGYSEERYIVCSTNNGSLKINIEREDMFIQLIERARSEPFFQKTGLLSAISAEDCLEIWNFVGLPSSYSSLSIYSKKDIAKNHELANLVKSVKTKFNNIPQTTSYLIEKLQAAIEIQPIQTFDEIIAQDSQEAEEIFALSYMLHIFYAVAHWLVQNIREWHTKMLAEQAQS